MPFSEDFVRFYQGQPEYLQRSIECCLEWILTESFFPPEGLRCTHSPPGTYHMQVPNELATLCLTADIPSPGILGFTGGYLGDPPKT